jgi:hypothetical protein
MEFYTTNYLAKTSFVIISKISPVLYLPNLLTYLLTYLLTL